MKHKGHAVQIFGALIAIILQLTNKVWWHGLLSTILVIGIAYLAASWYTNFCYWKGRCELLEGKSNPKIKRGKTK